MALDPNEVWWNDEWLKKHAKYWFGRYPLLASHGYEWEDVYQEGVYRLLKGENRVPSDGRQKKYLKTVCFNICSEYHKDILRLKAFFDSDAYDDTIEMMHYYLEKIQCKCKLLLKWWYLDTPPGKKREEIVALINSECGRKYSPRALHMHMRPCLDEILKLIITNPDGWPDNLKKK